MKSAFICDWLTGMRGGEKCLKAMCEVFPNADIYTLVYYPDNFDDEFSKHSIYSSFIQKFPGNDKTFRRYLPLFPKAIESFDLEGYDLIISFSHCVAKSVIAPSHVPHICYCHTPMRYAWDMRQQYLSNMSPLKMTVASFILNRLQKWDAVTANRVDHYIANSRHVQERIKRCYGRSSRVIYPPLDVDRFEANDQSGDYYLVFSAMVPYKRIDLAIEAFNKNRRRLVIAGDGPELNRLRGLANNNIEFILKPDDQAVQQLYSGCRALVFPGQEDFGIVPLEAQASGKPVIAYAKGGSLETIIPYHPNSEDQPTGLFFDKQTVTSLQNAVNYFEENAEAFSPQVCRKNAQRFNTERYQKQMIEYAQEVTDVAIV